MNQLYNENEKKRYFLEDDLIYKWRSPFRRDYARLVHSSAFRRLSNKTQLFPGGESDFFRNRLTHSLEVAQIAKSIGQKFNFENNYFKKNNIDLDLLELASLAHDIGHPPFGHIGERALDDCMKSYGGFEGNAQTLRIIACLEKKVKGNKSDANGFIDSNDERFGLNLTYRSMASVLKYNNEISPKRDKKDKLSKGYYSTESDLVKKIIENVTGKKNFKGTFKTIECDIMDIADDIAYSTFDLEDSFKAGFINPLNFFAINKEILPKVHEKVILNEELRELTESDVYNILKSFFSSFLNRENYEDLKDQDLNNNDMLLATTGKFFLAAQSINHNGFIRMGYSSALITEFINGVDVKVNKEIPALSSIVVKKETKAKIECVKHFIFYSITMSNRLKIPEYRGYEIVNSILCTLNEEKFNPGFEILPDDFKEIYIKSKGSLKQRVICDYVAGMTDRYVVEFYGRLKSENPETIFKSI